MSFARGFAVGGLGTAAATAAAAILARRRKEAAEADFGGFGLPERAVASELRYPHHALCYDAARKIPLWVAERIERRHCNECSECNALAPVFGTSGERVSRKKAKFRPDPQLPPEASATNDDYWRSGWSRGHMAPAGDNKHSQEAMNATFLLSNILPQDLKNNGGYWNLMELWVRDLTEKFDRVSIVSGPLFRPEVETDSGRRFLRHEVIGKSGVAVPTHLYKVVAAERGDAQPPLLAAFVVPNARVPLERPLTDYQVPLESLEAEIGFRLFPRLDRSQGLHSLCASPVGCALMAKADFLRIVYSRQMEGARKLHYLRRQWAKVERDGLSEDATLRGIYERRLAELSAKETSAETPTPVPA